MRFLLAIVVGLCSLYCSGQSLQKLELSIEFSDNTIEHCLNKISRKYPVTFSYNSKVVKAQKKPFTGTYNQIALELVLADLFKGSSLDFLEFGNQITVYERKEKTDSYQLNGYVRDLPSQEALVGATVFFPDLNLHCISNTSGYYSIVVPGGEHLLQVHSLGHKPLAKTIQVQADMLINLGLSPSTVDLSGVEISGKQVEVNPDNPLAESLELLGISNAVVGESDLTKFIQVLPGVQPATDGGSEFLVRGASSGKNLFLLDNAPVYHPTHLLGLFSIFNSDAINSAELIRDHVPAKYSGRTSSILDVQLKEGNLKEFHASGGIGLVSGNLNLEGPILKNKSSFYLSGKRSYLDLFRDKSNPDSDIPDLFFHDLSLKVNFILNSNNRLYASAYNGGDRLLDAFSYAWGNRIAALRWNHLFGSKAFSNLNYSYSNFFLAQGENDLSSNGTYYQYVIHHQLLYDLTHYVSNSLQVNYGVQSILRQNNQGRNALNAEVSQVRFKEKQTSENGVWAQATKRLGEKVEVSMGLRIPYYFEFGNGDTAYNLTDQGLIDTVIAPSGKPINSNITAEPRVSVSVGLNQHHSLSFSGEVLNQYTHIVDNNASFPPIEIWYGANDHHPAERSYQSTLKWQYRHKKNTTSIVGFFRKVENVLDVYQYSKVLSLNQESNLLATDANFYGIEFLSTQQLGKLRAMLAYTWTQTQQKHPLINSNQPYVSNQDRPHYLNLLLNYKWSEKWTSSLGFVWHSGTAATLPNAKVLVDGNAFPVYTNRNGDRLPAYHRLDLSFIRQLGVKRKKDRGSLVFAINNVYNQHNASFVQISQDEDNPDQLSISSINYLPFFPSVAYNFKF